MWLFSLYTVQRQLAKRVSEGLESSPHSCHLALCLGTWVAQRLRFPNVYKGTL